MGRNYRSCAVPGCLDTLSPRHRFPNPHKDSKRYNTWVEVIQNSTLSLLDPQRVYANYRVCHQHFTIKDISSNMYLVKTAVPTQKLPPATGPTASTSQVVNGEEALNTIKTEELSLPVEACATLTDDQHSPPRVGDIIRPVELIPKAKHFRKARNLQKVNGVYKLRNFIPFQRDHACNERSTQSTNPNHSVERQTTENSTPESSLTVSQQQPVITYKNTKRQRLTQLNSIAHQPKGIAETVNPPPEENEFEVFGRSIGLQLKAMPIQIAVKAQQHIQTYLSTIRLQHMASNQDRCCQASTTPPACSDNDSDVQARTRGSCGVLLPSAASSGIRATLKRPP